MVRVLEPGLIGFTLVGHRRRLLGQPPVLPEGPALLPQREQLGGSASGLRSVPRPRERRDAPRASLSLVCYN